jgi:hypothetical protein
MAVSTDDPSFSQGPRAVQGLPSSHDPPSRSPATSAVPQPRPGQSSSVDQRPRRSAQAMSGWSLPGRSAAGTSGVCAVQPSRWRSSRLTGLGVNRTPVSRSITSATCGALHTSPSKPWAAGPCSNACSISGSWSRESLALGPSGIPAPPRRRSASGSPTRPWSGGRCLAAGPPRTASGLARTVPPPASDASGPASPRQCCGRCPAAHPQTMASGPARTVWLRPPAESGPWRRCWPRPGARPKQGRGWLVAARSGRTTPSGCPADLGRRGGGPGGSGPALTGHVAALIGTAPQTARDTGRPGRSCRWRPLASAPAWPAVQPGWPPVAGRAHPPSGGNASADFSCPQVTHSRTAGSRFPPIATQATAQRYKSS